MPESAKEISRLEQANTLGLAYARSVIVLNGGGILALLTFVGNAEAQTALSIPLSAIKFSMAAFSFGIATILSALLISYSFTAANPETRYSQFWDKRIIPTNGVLALFSLLSMLIAIFSLLMSATNS